MENKKDSVKEDAEFLANWLKDMKLKDNMWSIVNKWNTLCCQVDIVEDRVDALEKDAIKRETKKSERLSNFALGFSIFTFVVVVFVEVVTKFSVKYD